MTDGGNEGIEEVVYIANLKNEQADWWLLEDEVLENDWKMINMNRMRNDEEEDYEG